MVGVAVGGYAVWYNNSKSVRKSDTGEDEAG